MQCYVLIHCLPARLPAVPQDGQIIQRSERIAAAQVLASLEQQLLQELQAEGVDVAAAAGVEDDSSTPDGEVAETGFVDEAGELRRPWCPATRILEHREMVRCSCSTSDLAQIGNMLVAVWSSDSSSYWYAEGGNLCWYAEHRCISSSTCMICCAVPCSCDKPAELVLVNASNEPSCGDFCCCRKE